MGRGRRILLAGWIVANAAVLTFLVMNPQVTRERCERLNLSRGPTEICTEAIRPVVERKYVVAGAILGTGVALAAWVTVKPRA